MIRISVKLSNTEYWKGRIFCHRLFTMKSYNCEHFRVHLCDLQGIISIRYGDPFLFVRYILKNDNDYTNYKTKKC